MTITKFTIPMHYILHHHYIIYYNKLKYCYFIRSSIFQIISCRSIYNIIKPIEFLASLYENGKKGIWWTFNKYKLIKIYKNINIYKKYQKYILYVKGILKY